MADNYASTQNTGLLKDDYGGKRKMAEQEGWKAKKEGEQVKQSILRAFGNPESPADPLKVPQGEGLASFDPNHEPSAEEIEEAKRQPGFGGDPREAARRMYNSYAGRRKRFIAEEIHKQKAAEKK
jgi:hypothetical protein